jgi:hypothetical protein
MSAIDMKIRDMFNNLATTELLPKDKHLTGISLLRLPLFQRIHKVEWLDQATLALAQAKKRHFWIRRAREEHHRRHQAMIGSMQHTFSNWLHTAH